MHDLLLVAAFLFAALMLLCMLKAIHAFELLGWAECSQGARLSSYCGYNYCFLPERVVLASMPSPLCRWSRW
jgi:hypothetical protein